MNILYKRSHIQTQGFTLIELSIVLVIISLIVGGVIGGKALINSAKLQNIAKEINILRTAVNSYELQYDALPGDHSEAQSYFGATACPNGGGGTNPCNGNGNNQISDNSGYEDTRNVQHMMLADILNNNVNIWTSNGGGAQFMSKYGLNANLSIYYSSSAGKHYIRFANNSTSGGYYARSVLSPQDARSIDRKYDDDKADTGKIRGSRTGGHYYTWTDSVNCTSGSAYRLDNSGPICILAFER